MLDTLINIHKGMCMLPAGMEGSSHFHVPLDRILLTCHVRQSFR
jgi:hypothetical protein